MSTLYIREHARQGRDISGQILGGIPAYPSAAEQTVAIGGASAASAAFQASTTQLVLCSDVACSVAIGVAPVATATNWRLAANVPVSIAVREASNLKLAVIANT
jgi:hypothetical protein